MMPPPLTMGGEGVVLSDRPSVVRPFVVCSSVPISRDMISLYSVEGLQWNLPQIFSIRLGISENVLNVRGQRSRSYVYKCVNALTAEAYISTVWRWGSLVQLGLQCRHCKRLNPLSLHLEPSGWHLVNRLTDVAIKQTLNLSKLFGANKNNIYCKKVKTIRANLSENFDALYKCNIYDGIYVFCKFQRLMNYRVIYLVRPPGETTPARPRA